MKTAKVKLMNVINNGELLRKNDLYATIHETYSSIFNELLSLEMSPIDDIYRIFRTIFSNNGSIKVYMSKKIYQINPGYFVEFTKQFIDPLLIHIINIIYNVKERETSGLSGLDTIQRSCSFHLMNNTDTGFSCRMDLLKKISEVSLFAAFNDEEKEIIVTDLYALSNGYINLLFNLMNDLEVEFYAGDDE